MRDAARENLRRQDWAIGFCFWILIILMGKPWQIITPKHALSLLRLLWQLSISMSFLPLENQGSLPNDFST